VRLPQLISVTPSPIPSVPCWVLVCYDFDSTGATSPVILEVSFGGTPYEFRTEVSKENPCVRVYVPAGATDIIIVDSTAQSQDGGALVEPD
jgi:hypothetical protein